MILEGLVTTLTPEGQLHLAPMGALLSPQDLGEHDRPDGTMRRFLLRPFQTAQTYRNLRQHSEGVFHLTDDVLLLAQAAIGKVEPFPAVRPAACVLGYIVEDACRYYEFRIVGVDDRQERACLEAEVLAAGRLRDFLGFNRARHAVIEAAILATRIHLLPRDAHGRLTPAALRQIDEECRRLRALVDKTGGPREHAAFDLLCHYVRAQGSDQPDQQQ
ncbi:hypothetical protein HRbin36_01977 [bacterium HR36]|nr:hypothetical protein HRbin36_01977 [bacterium HR36]